MGRLGRMNIRDLKKFQKELEKLQDPDMFLRSCAKELAAILLAKVIKRTPVGDYSYEINKVAKRDSKNHKKGDVYKVRVNPNGKQGGTLRRGWTAETESLAVQHIGNSYVIEIINPVEYASYVEYGHRTANHKGWVEGQFMMTISEQELETIAPKILEQRLMKYLKECMG